MDMKKAIIIGLIVVVVIAGLVFLFRKPASSPTPGGTGALPTSTPPVTTVPTSTPSGTMLTIGTTQGSVQVNNFYKNPVQITPDRTSVLINDTPSYDISYYAPDSSFIISILAQPV